MTRNQKKKLTLKHKNRLKKKRKNIKQQKQAGFYGREIRRIMETNNLTFEAAQGVYRARKRRYQTMEKMQRIGQYRSLNGGHLPSYAQHDRYIADQLNGTA